MALNFISDERAEFNILKPGFKLIQSITKNFTHQPVYNYGN
jgi:hypothetical protein